MFIKQDIIKAAIFIWIIGSVVYISYDTWNDYKIRGVQQAYQAGVEDSVKKIFDKVQASQCKQAVELTSQDNKLEIIDLKCLSQQSADSQQKQGTSSNQPVSVKK